MYAPRAITILYTSIINKVSKDAGDIFLSLVINSNYGKIETERPMTDESEIKLINDFWRSILVNYDNTLEIRAWLTDSDNLEAYVNAFEKNWLYPLANLVLIPKNDESKIAKQIHWFNGAWRPIDHI